jgi:hypothetical protein
MVWRPSLPESLDGAPLATSINELFFGFPYANLPKSRFTAFFMRPDCMLAMIILYLLSKSPVKEAKLAIGIDPNTMLFRTLVALHNLALAIFSGLVAWHSWGVVVPHMANHGWRATFCDVDGDLWASGLGAWSTVFYISKYYEFADTWILLLKGKEASFLQVYHHAGIVFNMWGAVASQSSWLLSVVLLNSMIHTLMYTYFLLKTIEPKIEIKAAKYLTQAQIGQFFTGILSTLPVLYWGDQCDSQSSRFMLICLHVYGYGLIALFVAFSAKKYKKR